MADRFEDIFRQLIAEVVEQVIARIHPVAIPSRDLTTEPLNPNQLLLRPKEAAAALAISPAGLRRLTKRGGIASVQVGSSRRYSFEALKQWIANNESSIVKPVSLELDRSRPKEPREVIATGSRAPRNPQTASKAKPSRTKRPQPTADPEHRDSGFSRLIEKLGLDYERFAKITNGELMQIAQVDFVTYHNWSFKCGVLPDDAIKRLTEYVLAQQH